ncbi:MAG: DUF2027 domain-containing protein [Bacteroidia bacterium]|nr:DUF2027 domain-containing protein [Bacteroidia bacterium]
MNLNIGDKVKFLNDVGGGIVTKILDKKMVSVRTKDDWEIPVMVSELIRIDKEDDMEVVRKYDETGYEEPAVTDSDNGEPENDEEYEAENNDDPKMALYFSLISKDPNDATGNVLKAFLVNDTDHFVLYNYVVKINKVSTCRETGTLEPDTKLFLETFQKEVFRQSFSIILQLIFYKQGIYQPVAPVEKVIAISYSRFFLENQFTVNDFFDEKAIMIKCAELEVI